MNPIEQATVHLGINPDANRVEEGWCVSSMIDLRDTDTQDAYVTLLWTDMDLIEHVSVVHVKGDTSKTITNVVLG